ncbi:MAG TPA: hypothetical protein VHB21_04790 [Minicystis sp.]|nr:hypothetical protein [Minicystis sp.]
MRALFVLLSAAALVACSDGETVNPAPRDAGVDASQPDAGGGGAGGAPKRTVVQKNPFGDVKETGNLLWDGDFEWFSVFSDEYGWLDGPPFTSYTFTSAIVSAQCLSGLKCAKLASFKDILGVAVAVKDKPLEVSFWATPAGGECKNVKGSLISPFDAVPQDPAVDVPEVASHADGTGWCHYHAIVPARVDKPGLLVENVASSTDDHPVLVDDCVIKEAPEGATPTAPPMDAARLPRVRELQAELKRRKGPHDPPPNPARTAFERWKKQRR